MSMVFIASFKSQLASIMTIQHDVPLPTIDQLPSLGYQFQTNKKYSSSLIESLNSSNDKTFTTILNEMKNDYDLCDIPLQFNKKKLAVIDEDITITHQVKRDELFYQSTHHPISDVR